jgi:hypothetical protein
MQKVIKAFDGGERFKESKQTDWDRLEREVEQIKKEIWNNYNNFQIILADLSDGEYDEVKRRLGVDSLMNHLLPKVIV